MTGVETVERWYASRDASLLADDIRWTVLQSFPAGGEYRGKAAVLDDFFPRLLARFDSFGADPARFFSDGDTIIVLGTYRATGRNGVAVVSAFAHLWTLRAGRIAAFEQIADTAALRRALA